MNKGIRIFASLVAGGVAIGGVVAKRNSVETKEIVRHFRPMTEADSYQRCLNNVTITSSPAYAKVLESCKGKDYTCLKGLDIVDIEVKKAKQACDDAKAMVAK